MSFLDDAWGAVKSGVSSAASAVADVAEGAVEATGAFVVEFTLGPVKLADALVSGRRIDKALVDRLNATVKVTRDIAPYAQAVVSMVPGIGTGVSGAIGAGLALAQGKPLDDALVAGIRGAVPGGAVGQAAFNAAVAVVEGKSVEQIAVAALPISAAEKTALGKALTVAKQVAAGENIATSVITQVSDAIPAAYRPAITIGMSVAMGKKIQASKVAGLAVSAVNTTSALATAKKVVADLGHTDPRIAATANLVYRGTLSAAAAGIPSAQRAASVLSIAQKVSTVSPSAPSTAASIAAKASADRIAAMSAAAVAAQRSAQAASAAAVKQQTAARAAADRAAAESRAKAAAAAAKAASEAAGRAAANRAAAESKAKAAAAATKAASEAAGRAAADRAAAESKAKAAAAATIAVVRRSGYALSGDGQVVALANAQAVANMRWIVAPAGTVERVT